jgi:hypothetical protein
MKSFRTAEGKDITLDKTAEEDIYHKEETHNSFLDKVLKAREYLSSCG